MEFMKQQMVVNEIFEDNKTPKKGGLRGICVNKSKCHSRGGGNPGIIKLDSRFHGNDIFTPVLTISHPSPFYKGGGSLQ